MEFALVLPMLLILLLGIADFGRVFASGITLEAAARDAAEAAAQEYLRNPPADMTLPAPPGNAPYYQTLHDLAARTACREARGLNNSTYSADVCASMPVIQVCVHDDADPLCDQTAFGATIPNPQCDSLLTPPTNAMQGGTEASRYVEVRICYKFTTLLDLSNLQLPFGWGLSIGDLWLQKDRAFTIGWYPPIPTPEPPPPPPPPPSQPAPTDTPVPTQTAVPTPTPTPACQVPIANFTASKVSGNSPLLVAFTDTSVPLDCPILSWDWNFGDGSAHATTQNASHTFTWPGPASTKQFTVALTVASAAGPSTKSLIITVHK